jgi:hypothetical protein
VVPARSLAGLPRISGACLCLIDLIADWEFGDWPAEKLRAANDLS